MKIVKFFVAVGLLLLTQAVVGQTAKQRELERRREKLQVEISKMSRMLQSTQKQGKDLLVQLKELNQKIDTRQKLIVATEEEAAYLSELIDENTDVLNVLQKDLNALKKDYANMMFKSYKRRSTQNKLMFLFSSESFQQAYRRYQYMQQYAVFRKKQGDSIITKSDKIKYQTDLLSRQKQQKERLLAQRQKEKETVQAEKSKQEILAKQVKAKEVQYIAEIRRKEAEDKKLDKAIEKIIRDAIAASRAKAAAEAAAKAKANNTVVSGSNSNNKSSVVISSNTAVNTSVSGFKLTPEAEVLANRFESNRGKLPWPVAEGYISRGYGIIPHPTLNGIQIESKGIHITTKSGAGVRAVFNGKVLAVQSVSGRNAVYIQHGNYISLYNNLEKVYVNKGQDVTVKQPIGTVFTDKVTNETVLKFQLWRDTERQNPTVWLSRM